MPLFFRTPRRRPLKSFSIFISFGNDKDDKMLANSSVDWELSRSKNKISFMIDEVIIVYNWRITKIFDEP